MHSMPTQPRSSGWGTASWPPSTSLSAIELEHAHRLRPQFTSLIRQSVLDRVWPDTHPHGFAKNPQDAPGHHI